MDTRVVRCDRARQSTALARNVASTPCRNSQIRRNRQQPTVLEAQGNSAVICTPPALTNAHPVKSPLPLIPKVPIIDTGA
jgi:hypothetical protein